MGESHAIEEKIYEAIRKVKPSLQAVPMTPETRFDSLGLQSLERAIVVFELEDAYGLSIVDANLDRFHTIAEARDVVAKLLEKKPRVAEGAS
jgi:acyl carrier protein